MAWLHVAPDSQGKGGSLTRLEAHKRDGREPYYPPCDVEYMVGYLWEMGPVSAAGMGPVPITHTEIRAWQENTGIELTSWEARTLRHLSQEYAAEIQRAKDPNCPSPCTVEPTQERRKALPKLIKNALRG